MTRDEINTVAKLIKRMAVQLEQERSAHKTALAEMRTSFLARTGADEKLIEDRRMEIIRLNTANDRLNDLLRAERLARRDAVEEMERLREDEWSAKGCEPCDPPEATVKLAPKVGDTVRLVTHPERGQVAEHLRTALQWPWIDRWGVVGQTGKVVAGCRYIPGAVAVATDSHAHWPLSCVEVVAEATHDTEAGKAAAERTVRTEPVADEIKVWDVVEVYQATGKHTAQNDVGFIGTVGTIHLADRVAHVRSGLGMPHMVDLCDVRKVRKVTT